jgi:hypothetical protein
VTSSAFAGAFRLDSCPPSWASRSGQGDWLGNGLMRKAGTVPGSGVNARGVALVDDATDPVAPLGDDTAPRRQDDITAQSTKPAADEGTRRSFAHRIRSRAVWLPLACVAALLVGFGSMTVLLRLGDRPAQSDTKRVPTTAAPVAPAPSAAAPAVTPPPSTAGGPAVEDAPPLPAPESATPASAPMPTETTPPPNQNPAGHAPPGLNR